MKTQDLIKILKNNQFSDKTAELLRQEVAKYPYFTPLVVAYLLSLKISDNINFKNELSKFSIYISNHRTLIKKLIEIDYLKATNKLKTDKEIDEEQLQKELYERSKQHHDQIVQEIIEPKIEKLRKLSELAKQKDEIFSKTETHELPSEQTKETETKPEQPVKATTTEEKTPDKQPAETKAEEFETNTISTPEKTQQELPIEQPKTEKQPQASSIDDIFKKIEELKKQKLRAVSDFEKRVSTVDRLIGEQKVREEISPAEQRLAERRKRREERLKAKAEAAKAKEEAKEKTKEETKEQKAKSSEPISVSKQEQTPAEETQLIDFEIPVNNEEKQPETKPKDEILIPSPQPQKEETEEKTETQTITQEATTQETKDQTTQTKQPETQTDTLQESKPTTTSSGKKSAADKILEEIARRREMRKKKQIELIERFLEEQPSIDRNKKPSIEGDLSEPHTKEIEVVTEKMAQIYEMQGLYDKAINIYQKLILQKPEKKDYFAQKIEQLKQQINN